MKLFRSFLGTLVALVFITAFTTSAEAHRLKLFVSVEGMTVSGYAFFVGGGRPQDVDFFIKDGTGSEVHRGRTNAEGAFSWAAEKPADYVLSIDTGDGHFADEKIPSDRFSPEAAAAAPATAAVAPTETATPITAPQGPAPTGPTPVFACPTPVDPALLSRLTEAAADRAMARQLRPLVEAQNLAEGRLRFNDIMGGIGMIVGLAGLGAWGLSRRRERGGPGA